MPFVHAKNARIYLDAFDMSRYFNEASMQAKVDTPETTSFAITPGISVSKTVIPGIKEGTISLKGLFDPTVTASTLTASSSGPDAYLHQIIAQETGVGTILVPSNIETCVSIAPTGSWTPGQRVWAAANVMSQYQLQSPIKNAVMISATLQCDGGVDTGVSLHDPTVSETLPTSYCTIASGVVLPQATLTAATGNPSTAGYPTAGSLLVPTGTGFAIVAYTGVTSTTFTGCTGGTGTTTASTLTPFWFATGVNDQQLPQESVTGPSVTVATAQSLPTTPFTLLTTGNPITAGFPRSGQIVVPISGSTLTLYYTGITATQFLNVTGGTGTTTVSGTITLAPISSIMGAYGFLHVGAVPGSTTGVLLAKLQHSDDNATWTDVSGGAWTLGTFTQGQFGSGQNAGGSAPGSYILTIPAGITIQRFVRLAIGYGAAATSATVLATLVRL